MSARERTSLDIVVLGLSLSSSWGNGHATTYRGLLRELSARGHRIRFLERDLPFYADNRDLPAPDFCELHLYASFEDLVATWAEAVSRADVVIVGSYVPEGIRVGQWIASVTSVPSSSSSFPPSPSPSARSTVRAFYDIDTPVTLAELEAGSCEYLSAELVPRYDLYLSFTGGPTLDVLERRWGSPCARALYCSVDPALYSPEPSALTWDLGYLGTYSRDRQPALDALLLEAARREPARRFVVAGPQYPADTDWPGTSSDSSTSTRRTTAPSTTRNAQRST